MKKSFLFILFLFSITWLNAQMVNDSSMVPTTESSKDGQNKFAIFGNAEMIFFSQKNDNQFGDVKFKPIFLWKISDKLFVEAEPEFDP